jgi:hypothetical protein
MRPTIALTMRLSGARQRRRETKLLYPHHQPSPWSNEAVPRRPLEPLVRRRTAESPRYPSQLRVDSKSYITIFPARRKCADLNRQSRAKACTWIPQSPGRRKHRSPLPSGGLLYSHSPWPPQQPTIQSLLLPKRAGLNHAAQFIRIPRVSNRICRNARCAAHN